MRRTDFRERPRVELVGSRDRNPAGGERPQRGGTASALQQRTLAQDRSGTDFSNSLTVDLDVQNSVQQQEDRVAGCALLDQGLAGAETFGPGPRAASHDLQ